MGAEAVSTVIVMYGLIACIKAVPGKRDELASILLADSAAMPGCRSYIVATDPTEPDSLWVTEVWADEASHGASLELESVQAAIAKGRPLIAGFRSRVATQPLGGVGLPG
jgi:quinol monooxygenase YgiN